MATRTTPWTKRRQPSHARQSSKMYQPPNPQLSQPQSGCYRCGAKGHFANECRRSRNQTCIKCEKIGHFTEMCKSTTAKPKMPFQSGNSKQQHRHSNRREQKHRVHQTTVNNDSSSEDDINIYRIRNK